jgi:hypothetical protein
LFGDDLQRRILRTLLTLLHDLHHNGNGKAFEFFFVVGALKSRRGGYKKGQVKHFMIPQRHENPLNKGVGEPPRGLPQNNSEDGLLGNQSKKWFLQWIHIMITILLFSFFCCVVVSERGGRMCGQKGH